MPAGNEVVTEQEVPEAGLTETDLLIDLNDNITQLSNYIQERNVQLDAKEEALAKEVAKVKAEEKELAQQEKEASAKLEKLSTEKELAFRKQVMEQLNEISEMPQYESNEEVLAKLELINDNMALQKQSDHIVNGYGIIIIPAILLIWLLWKTFKNATDGLL